MLFISENCNLIGSGTFEMNPPQKAQNIKQFKETYIYQNFPLTALHDYMTDRLHDSFTNFDTCSHTNLLF